MGMGARLTDQTSKRSNLPSPQEAAADMVPLLVAGLKRELAGMLLRQWDLGHATTHLEGSDVASSVPAFDDRQLDSPALQRHPGGGGGGGGGGGMGSGGIGDHLTPKQSGDGGGRLGSGGSGMGAHHHHLSVSSSGAAAGGGGVAGGTSR